MTSAPDPQGAQPAVPAPVRPPAGPAAERRALCETLGVPDCDPDLLELALTHRSFAYEHGGLPTNERLEFLGDSVLGLVVTDLLYSRHPDLSEGRLAKLRAAVVNSHALADVGRALGLGEHLRLGRGETATGGRDKSSILADTVEALLGAVYLQHGFGPAARVVRSLFGPLLDDAARRGAGLDWKTSLQELASLNSLGVPEYVVAESGPDHAKSFTAQVRVGERLHGDGRGPSKKAAEQLAAETAWHEIRTVLGPGPRGAEPDDPGSESPGSEPPGSEPPGDGRLSGRQSADQPPLPD